MRAGLHQGRTAVLARVILALVLLVLSFAPAYAAGRNATFGDAPNVVPTLPDGDAPASTDVTTPATPMPSDPATVSSNASVVTQPQDEHASGGGGLPQFDATWFPSQIFWLAITFFLMYRFFSRTALPRIADTIAARAGQVQGDITSAETLANQAKSVRIGYERDIARAKDKAGEAIRDVDAKIKQKTADLLYSYRTKLTMETTRAMDDLNREKARLVGDMHALAADMTARSVSQILDQSVDMDQAARVIEQIDPTRRAA